MRRTLLSVLLVFGLGCGSGGGGETDGATAADRTFAIDVTVNHDVPVAIDTLSAADTPLAVADAALDSGAPSIDLGGPDTNTAIDAAPAGDTAPARDVPAGTDAPLGTGGATTGTGGATAVGGTLGTGGSGGGTTAGTGGATPGSGGSTGAAGSTGTGGGSGAQADIITFEQFAFYNPALVAGTDGVVHLLYNTNTSPSEMYYAHCADNCGVGSNWTQSVIATDQFLGGPRLVIGSDNRLHVVYDVVRNSGPSEIVYATCAGACDQAAAWTKTDLASLFGGGWTAPFNGSPIAIDATDRISFTVDRSTYLDGGLTLATCASGCSTLANWTAGRIGTGIRTSLTARGTTLHQLVDNRTGSTATTALSYRTCASDCTAEASWKTLPGIFAYGGDTPTAIAVTATGGVRVVYNQGTTDAGQPAAVKAQDNRMLFWSCDADCLQAASWSGLMLGAARDGENGLAMAEAGGAVVVAVTNPDRAFAAVCGQDCTTETAWQVADIDTSDALSALYDPYVRGTPTCSGVRPMIAGWSLSKGVVAVRPDGAVAFAHVGSILRTCVGSTGPSYQPGYGRVAYFP